MGLVARKRADSPKSYGHIGNFASTWTPRSNSCILFKFPEAKIFGLSRPNFFLDNIPVVIEDFTVGRGEVGPTCISISNTIVNIDYTGKAFPFNAATTLQLDYSPNTVNIGAGRILSGVWRIVSASPNLIYTIAYASGNMYVPPRLGWTIANDEWTGTARVERTPFQLS